MGLDIGFDRQKAVAAGLVLDIQTNGSKAQLDYYLNCDDENTDEDEDYISWLFEKAEVVWIPGCDHCTENNGLDGSIVVRANKWGDSYEPLTAWLKENNIEWSEF